MRRNVLLGTPCDAIAVLAAACGYNLCRILEALRLLHALILTALTRATAIPGTSPTSPDPLLASA